MVNQNKHSRLSTIHLSEQGNLAESWGASNKSQTNTPRTPQNPASFLPKRLDHGHITRNFNKGETSNEDIPLLLRWPYRNKRSKKSSFLKKTYLRAKKKIYTSGRVFKISVIFFHHRHIFFVDSTTVWDVEH